MKKFVYLLSISTLSALQSPKASASSQLSETRRIQENQSWMLNNYMSMAEQTPSLLIQAAQDEFSPENIKSAQSSPDKAFAWQDRAAYLTALTQLYNPEATLKATAVELKHYRVQARDIIQKALISDPALLVRDAAVESIRRINRMRPTEASQWKSILENAFLDRKNSLDGEGLFIRETILSALREGSLKLDAKIKRSAELDQNIKVRNLVGLWSTRAFGSL